MLSVVQIIQTICPKLADSPSLSTYVQMAQESLNSRFYGKKINCAIAYKACHLFTISNSKLTSVAGGSGSVQGYSEGGMSIQFGSSNSESELNSTQFGRMLKDLNKSIPKMDVNRGCGILLGGC